MTQKHEINGWVYPQRFNTKEHYVTFGFSSLCGVDLNYFVKINNPINTNWQCKNCQKKLKKLQNKNND